MGDHESSSQKGSSQERDDDGSTGFVPPLSRRSTLALLSAAGLGLTSQSTVAANTTRTWKQDVDADGYSLTDLGALSTRSNPTEIEDFEGENLTIDDGVLHSSAADGLSASIKEDIDGEPYGEVTIDDLSHTLRVSGTRTQAWMMRPFLETKETTSPSYVEVGDGIGWGVLPFPPGYAPVFRVTGHFNNDDGVKTYLRVSVANNQDISVAQDPVENVDNENENGRVTVLEVVGEGESTVYDEVYLNEQANMTTTGKGGGSDRQNTFFFEMKTEDPTATAAIERSTTVALELEAM